MKKLHEETKLFRALYIQGIRNGLWKDREGAANAIGIPPPTFKGYLNGYTVMGGFDAAKDALEQKVTSVKDTPRANSLLHMYEQGWIDGLWTTKDQCASAIRISRMTFGKYFGEKELTGDEKKLSEKIRQRILTVLKKGSVKENKDDAASAVPHAPDTGSPDGGSTNPWLEKVLLHILSQPDQSQFHDGRFLLTAENFAPWDGTISDASIRDTVALILELQRRLKDFAQIKDKSTRAKLNKEIGPPLDALFEFDDLLRQVIPAGYLAKLALLQGKLDELRNQK